MIIININDNINDNNSRLAFGELVYNSKYLNHIIISISKIYIFIIIIIYEYLIQIVV